MKRMWSGVIWSKTKTKGRYGRWWHWSPLNLTLNSLYRQTHTDTHTFHHSSHLPLLRGWPAEQHISLHMLTGKFLSVALVTIPKISVHHINTTAGHLTGLTQCSLSDNNMWASIKSECSHTAWPFLCAQLGEELVSKSSTDATQPAEPLGLGQLN